MKKLLILLGLAVLTLSGCASEAPEVATTEPILYVNSGDIIDKMDNADTFAFVLGSADDPYSNDYKEVLNELYEEEGISLYYVDLAEEVDNQEDSVNLVNNYLGGGFEATPTTYFVVDGVVQEANVGAGRVDQVKASYVNRIVNKVLYEPGDTVEDSTETDSSAEDTIVYDSVNYITVQDLQDKLDNKETFVLVFAASGCSACKLYMDSINSFYFTNEVKLDYIDVNSDDVVDNVDQVIDILDTYLGGEFNATPTTFFIKDGELANIEVGAISASALTTNYNTYIAE